MSELAGDPPQHWHGYPPPGTWTYHIIPPKGLVERFEELVKENMDLKAEIDRLRAELENMQGVSK